MRIADPYKFLFYSPPGHGKTTLLGTAAGDERICPMLLLDFEAGTRSIGSKVVRIELNNLAKHKPTVDKITAVRILDWQDFDDVHEFLRDVEHGYRSVALDSLSEINYLNLTKTIDEAYRKDRKHDPDVAEQRDYLKSAGQMRRMVRNFRDLPLHVFFTALAQTAQDPISRATMSQPQLTGKLAFEIPGLVEVTGYMAVVEERQDSGEISTYRALLTDSTERYFAKDRTEGGKLGGFLADPTLPKIFDLLEGGEN